MVTACLEKREWKQPRIVFTVPLPERAPVFMSMEVTEYGMKNVGIVIVDAQKFLHLWRADPRGPHRAEANGTPETWPNDRKYDRAVDGFSHGSANPVPLAEVSFLTSSRTSVTQKFPEFGRNEQQENIEYVAFTDGITRTIWLLTHGCVAFPVNCAMSGARGLFMAAAAQGTSFHTLGELVKVAPQHDPADERNGKHQLVSDAEVLLSRDCR